MQNGKIFTVIITVVNIIGPEGTLSEFTTLESYLIGKLASEVVNYNLGAFIRLSPGGNCVQIVMAKTD